MYGMCVQKVRYMDLHRFYLRLRYRSNSVDLACLKRTCTVKVGRAFTGRGDVYIVTRGPVRDYRSPPRGDAALEEAEVV